MAGVLMVLANPVEGQEAEFDDWYTNVHVPELLCLSSFVGARRYRLNPAIPTSSRYRYLTVYEVTDSNRAAEEMGSAQGDLTMSPALDVENVIHGLFDEIPSPLTSGTA